MFLFLFLVGLQPAFAQEQMATEEATFSKTPTPVEYQLPYPGLLPDSPLYFLKIFRDKLMDFLVAHPVKKAELHLLQADKRLIAGEALFTKGKYDLSESTISKGENYFGSGVAKLQEAKKQGMDVISLTQKFSSSVKKHKQVIQSLIQKASGDVKKRLQNTEKRILEFENKVNALSPK